MAGNPDADIFAILGPHTSNHFSCRNHHCCLRFHQNVRRSQSHAQRSRWTPVERRIHSPQLFMVPSPKSRRQSIRNSHNARSIWFPDRRLDSGNLSFSRFNSFYYCWIRRFHSLHDFNFGCWPFVCICSWFACFCYLYDQCILLLICNADEFN